MTFKGMLLDDMKNVFCNSAEFAETITYKPAGVGSRSISAVVRRDPLQALQEVPQAVRPMVWVFVANDATQGISATELDVGADLVSLPPRPGATPEDFVIARVLAQDEGMLQLEVH